MKGIDFDHGYTNDPGFRFFESLGRCGFALSDHQVEHPGKQFCRFIMFPRGRVGRHYLEFVSVGRNGDPIDKPGISLCYEGKLARHFARIKDLKGVNAKYGHKNYKWKEDSKSRLPGWNFVTFRRPSFKNLFPWFTEYEPNPYTKAIPAPEHPNTAYGIYGMELSVREADRARLENIFGRKLPDGESELGGIQLFVARGRVTKVLSLVLKCRELKTFLRRAKLGAGALWRGRAAGTIKNTAAGMWDVIVVEG